LTVEIVEVSSCKKNITAEVPATEVDQEIDQIAREYARTVKVPGFRPGKVPLNIIRQRFGSDLRKEATQKIIERCWRDTITEHKLAPLTEPNIKEIENKPGEPLKFTLTFEVLPPLEVTDYKGVSVTLPSSEVTEESLNQAIETIRERNAQFVPVEGEAGDGMYVTLTIEGQFEGSEKPTREDDITLIIGHAQTNEEFSKNLRGAKPNDVRMFDVNYPEDYHRKQFAGKTVHYNVLVKDVKEKQLAELNDDFAKDVGSESFEALRNKVRDDLVTQARQNAEKKAREELLDSIVQRQTLEVPDCLVHEEVEAQAHRIANNLAYQGIDVRQASIDWNKVFEEDRPRAEQSVRRTLFLDAIARQEGIEVTDAEVDSELAKISEGTTKSAAALRAQLEKEERIHSFEQHLRQNKALDFIYRNANITEG
jgi:trigger factor